MSLNILQTVAHLYPTHYLARLNAGVVLYWIRQFRDSALFFEVLRTEEFATHNNMPGKFWNMVDQRVPAVGFPAGKFGGTPSSVNVA